MVSELVNTFIGYGMGSALAQELGALFDDLIKGQKTLREAIGQFAKATTRQLADMTATIAIMQMLDDVFDVIPAPVRPLFSGLGTGFAMLMISNYTQPLSDGFL